MSIQLIPNGKQQFIDINGKPLVGGTVGMYYPATLIFKNTWQDQGLSVLNSNPIVLDSRGQATIYGSGSYRQVVKDSQGNLIWDKLTSPGGDPYAFVARPEIILASNNPVAPIVTPEMYDALAGSGPTHDDAPAYQAALNANGYVTDLPWKTYYLLSNITVPSNSTYDGNGQIIIQTTGLLGFHITGSDAIIKNARIQGHASSNSITVSGARATIESTYHTGNCDFHIQISSGGDYAVVNNPKIVGNTNITRFAQIQVDSAINWAINNPVLENVYNFGIQIAAFSGQNSGGTVTNPRCTNPQYVPASQNGNGVTTVFNFTQSQQTVRNTVLVDGSVTTTGVTVTTGDNIHYVVTFMVAPIMGAIIQLLGWSALECFNINGPVSDLSITGGVLDGSGDSGIVMGDDFSLGSPSTVMVSGIAIRNMSGPGIIEETITCKGGDYSADIRDCSLGSNISDIAHSAGITLAGPSSIWRGGVISNTRSIPYMNCGVLYNGQAVVETGSVEKAVSIGPTVFRGTFPKRKFYIPQNSSVTIFGGIDLNAAPSFSYPGSVMADMTAAWAGVPTNSTFLNYSATIGAGWTRVTGVATLNGTACLQTIAASEGAIVFPSSGGTTTSFLVDSMLEITFWAILTSAGTGTPYLNVELVVSGSPTSLATPIALTGASWTQYRVCIPAQGCDRVRLISIGSTGTALANVDGISISYRPYN